MYQTIYTVSVLELDCVFKDLSASNFFPQIDYRLFSTKYRAKNIDEEKHNSNLLEIKKMREKLWLLFFSASNAASSHKIRNSDSLVSFCQTICPQTKDKKKRKRGDKKKRRRASRPPAYTPSIDSTWLYREGRKWRIYLLSSGITSSGMNVAVK